MKILIVDDHPQPRREVRLTLEKIIDAPTIFEFADAKTAVSYHQAHSDIDLIISDILMPEMNGIELAKKVLDHRMVPILFHTGSWSKNALYELLFQNITSEFPISIVNKSYFFQNPQEYEARLAHKIEEVQQKFIATTYPFNTSSLDKIISKISQKDNLIEYLKTIYDELFTQAHQAVSALAPDVIPSAIKQRILDQKLDLTPISTEQFYHNLRYPLSCMYSLLIPYARNNSCTLIINLLEKMETIKQYVQSE